ncbi:unnamed protein product [Spodoptera exigua]|nr:unnamed protein product [Spodoptera exigua]
MGQIDESKSTPKMAKSSSAVKKSSSTKGKGGASGGLDIDFSDPKVQVAVLVVLLTVLGAALWYGYTHGCLRRRRRRNSCC